MAKLPNGNEDMSFLIEAPGKCGAALQRLEEDAKAEREENAQRAKTGLCSRCGHKVNKVLICRYCRLG